MKINEFEDKSKIIIVDDENKFRIPDADEELITQIFIAGHYGKYYPKYSIGMTLKR